LEGIVDLITRKAIYFRDPYGTNLVYEEIPDHLKDITEEKRQELVGKMLNHNF
jgi:elongation factor G